MSEAIYVNEAGANESVSLFDQVLDYCDLALGLTDEMEEAIASSWVGTAAQAAEEVAEEMATTIEDLVETTETITSWITSSVSTYEETDEALAQSYQSL